jgi:hypothetical protein
MFEKDAERDEPRTAAVTRVGHGGDTGSDGPWVSWRRTFVMLVD